MYVRKSRQFGAILLVSGTTIGAGMIAQPALTGLAGFFPSLAVLVTYWVLSLFAAFLFLEVNLWFKEPVNLITMARYTLGKKGEIVTWLLYLLVLYALLAAYLSACGPMFSDAMQLLDFQAPPVWVAPLPPLAIFATCIALGTRSVDYLNRLLMCGLGASYCLLIGFTWDKVNPEKLFLFEPQYILIGLPVVVTSFGFHIVIPSLTNYLHKNVKVLKRTIFIGSVIPLVVYLLWQYVILGILPVDGSLGLKEVVREGGSVAYSLVGLLHNPWISSLARLFSFFAVTTSLLGVGLSLTHFLADGLRIHPNKRGRLLTLLLTFTPPLAFVLWYPKGFILALEYAGIFVAILLGILPCLMAWRGRRVHKGDVPFRTFGGEALLLICTLIYLLVIIWV